MSGYREHSFDPYAYEQPGKPLKPYNWVQWTGVAIAILGGAICVYYLLGKAGWVAPIDSPMPVAMLPLIGVALINSRREPGTPAGSEQLERNRKVLLVTVAVCAVILGAAFIFESVRS